MTPQELLYQMLGPGEIAFAFRYQPIEPEVYDPPLPAQWCPDVRIPWAQKGAVIRAMSAPESMIGLVPRRTGGGYEPTSCVWARLESTKHAQALRRFRPAPTLVLREGKSVKRTAIWGLTQPLDVIWLERANSRISYALGTKLKAGAPHAMVFAPGSRLSSGQPTWAEHVSDGCFTPREVVGRLRDRPAPNQDWRERAAA